MPSGKEKLFNRGMSKEMKKIVKENCESVGLL